MSFEFTQLWPLTLLAGLVLVWWWHHRSLAPLSPWRRRVAAITRTGVYLCVILALTEPRWFHSRRETHVLWLVDRSRSVGDRAVQMAREMAVEAPDVRQQTWATFAAQARVVPDLKEPLPPVRELQDDGSDLLGALKFAEACYPPGYARTLVLFSDGVNTPALSPAEAASAAESAAKSGIRVHVVPISAPDRPEVLVRSVEAPQSVREEEPFQVRAEVVANREMDVELDVFKAGVRITSKPEKLRQGSNAFEFTQTVRAGQKVSEIAVGVRVADPAQDAIADNNLAAAYVQAEGKSRVLLVADKVESARYLALALKQEGIVLDVRPPAGAPTDMADLQNYDLLILDNVPATALTMAQQRLFASYMRDFGGGLLMMGGDQSFGLGGYYRSPVEEVLPVRCDFEKEKENPSLTLVLVVDRSGSMGGEKMEMAKEAAKAAVEVLGPKDYAGVVGFDNEAFWVSEIQSAADRGGIQQRIAAVQPGGGTNIASGMELAFSRLGSAPGKLKHVIVLTDGVSSPGPFYELATQMAQQRITVTTVAVGSDADTALLEQIAGWGNGRYYYTDNAQSIPQIFTKETMTASKSAIQEAPFLPVVARPADFLSDVSFDTAPFLLGYVSTKLKPTAEVWLVTERGEPLLATWRYGLGQSAAFCSDARNRWAVEWLKWEGFGKFWAQVVRRVARAKALQSVPVEVAREKGGFRITATAVDAQGHFLSEVAGDAAVLNPSQILATVPLSRVAPGLFETWFPATQRGGYHAQLQLKNTKGEAVIRQYVSAAAGYSEEFLLQPVNETWLKTLAEKSGGKYGVKASEILANDDRKAPFEQDLWPWLIAAALALFVVDVAAKRWP